MSCRKIILILIFYDNKIDFIIWFSWYVKICFVSIIWGVVIECILENICLLGLNVFGKGCILMKFNYW